MASAGIWASPTPTGVLSNWGKQPQNCPPSCWFSAGNEGSDPYNPSDYGLLYSGIPLFFAGWGEGGEKGGEGWGEGGRVPLQLSSASRTQKTAAVSEPRAVSAASREPRQSWLASAGSHHLSGGRGLKATGGFFFPERGGASARTLGNGETACRTRRSKASR